MTIFKKIAFAPLFLISFTLLINRFDSYLHSYDFIFSFSPAIIMQHGILALLFWLSSYFFVLFSTLAVDWKLILPVGAFASVLPFILIGPNIAPVFMVANISAILLVSIITRVALQSYLEFKPVTILGPSIKLLSALFVFAFCLVYFLSINKVMAQNGFQIPDSFIDPVLKISNSGQLGENLPSPQVPKIDPEKLRILKDNPEVLEQLGLDSATLDFLTQMQFTSADQQSSGNTIKEVVRSQFQLIIRPYINFIPAALAALLFLLIHLNISVFNIFLTPILMLTFYILEKTGYTKYEIETREVKKLVV